MFETKKLWHATLSNHYITTFFTSHYYEEKPLKKSKDKNAWSN